jgi:hypothetical protein
VSNRSIAAIGLTAVLALAWTLASNSAAAASALTPALAPALGASAPPRGLAEVDDLLGRLGERGLRVDVATAIRSEGPFDVEGSSLSGVDLVRLAEAWIESDGSAEARLERLRRLQRLAESTTPEEAESLRFALATARYLAAAGGADRWRSGTDAPRRAEVLAAEFALAAEDFLRISARAERERASFASVLLRASGVEADLLSEAQQRLEARGLRASFLAGWSVLQRALLLGDASSAAEAAEILEPLLDAGRAEATPEDVSVDRRGDLGFAQTVLGLAIARGIVRGGDEGRRWLELLEIDTVDAGLKASLPVWALLMRTAAGEAEPARRLVESWRRRRDSDASWYAVALLEALRRGESADLEASQGDGLAETTADAWDRLARSAASGLIDLGREHRMRRLADEARLDGPWRPSGPLGAVLAALRSLDGASGSAQSEAARALLEAADIWPGPDLGLRLDAVVGLLESGASLEAWNALEAAAERLAGANDVDREQAAWLRLVAIDRLQASGRLAEAGLDQDAWPLAATAYLEGHPDGSRAALVAVRLGGEGLPLDRLVDLAMSGDPGVRRSVRSTIARRLATSEPEGRGEVLEAWRRLGPVEVERDARAAGDAEARREAYEAIAVLIAGEDGDLARARDLLMRLDPDGPGSGTDERAMARGLAAEVALASGDPVVARTSRQAALVAELDRSRQGSAGWIVARPSAWLQRVEVGWGRSRDAAARSRALAEAWASLAIESAEAVLSEAAGREAAPGSTTPTSSAELAIRAAALAAAGEAERYALRGVRTPSAAEPWRRAAERLAELADGEAGGPWRGEALEAVAAASAAAGRWNDVLDASRRLIAGRPRGGEAWRAAKALQIEALAELDPVQARAVLEQHRVLDPEWDRGAVGMRLRRLHERLPEALP